MGSRALRAPTKLLEPLPTASLGLVRTGDVTVDAGAAAHPECRWAVRQINLFNIGAGGEVLHSFHYFHYAGAALANTAAVVQVVETTIWIHTRIEGSLAQVGSFDATDLLAFLLKTDGGHDGRCLGADQLNRLKGGICGLGSEMMCCLT